MKHLTGQRHDQGMQALAVEKIPTCKPVTPREIDLLDEEYIHEEDET